MVEREVRGELQDFLAEEFEDAVDDYLDDVENLMECKSVCILYSVTHRQKLVLPSFVCRLLQQSFMEEAWEKGSYIVFLCWVTSIDTVAPNLISLLP